MDDFRHCSPAAATVSAAVTFLAVACGGPPSPQAPAPATAAQLSAAWTLDRDASSAPPAIGETERMATGVRAVRRGDLAELRRRAREAAANREAIGAVLAIAAERPERLELAVTDTTFRMALPRRTVALPIGGQAESMAGPTGVRIDARVRRQENALVLERFVTNVGTVADRLHIDDDGNLNVTRRVRMEFGAENTRTYRFVYRRTRQ